jgi:adenylate cyclase class 2
MALEIEAKMRLDDPAALRRRLAEGGAVCAGTRTLRDHYFDTPDHRLRDGDRGLRVRLADGAVLTYKGPRLEGPFKSRQELETRVADGEVLMQLLQQLGLVQVFLYEKRREQWRLDACAVSLDELPQLGCFVEIEGPSEQAIAQALRRLGLEGVSLVHESYLHLVAEHLEKHAPGSTSLLFD